jgi:hypothetical protein
MLARPLIAVAGVPCLYEGLSTAAAELADALHVEDDDPGGLRQKIILGRSVGHAPDVLRKLVAVLFNILEGPDYFIPSGVPGFEQLRNAPGIAGILLAVEAIEHDPVVPDGENIEHVQHASQYPGANILQIRNQSNNSSTMIGQRARLEDASAPALTG